jgi:hypothetical protein
MEETKWGAREQTAVSAVMAFPTPFLKNILT